MARKKRTKRTVQVDSLWVPAVNNHGRFGPWDFLEIADPWNAQNAIRNAPGITEQGAAR